MKLKKRFGFILGVGMILSSSIFSFAGEMGGNSEIINPKTKSVTSGYVDSDKDYKGYWIRGKKMVDNVNSVYSEYKNYKYEGRSSVTNGEGTYVQGVWKPKDEMSVSHTKWTSKGTNKANYNYKKQ